MKTGRSRKTSVVAQPSLQRGDTSAGPETDPNGPSNGHSNGPLADPQMGVLVQQVQALTDAVRLVQQQQATMMASQAPPLAPPLSRHPSPQYSRGRERSFRQRHSRRSPRRSPSPAHASSRHRARDLSRSPRSAGRGGHGKRPRSPPEASSEDSTPGLSRRTRESQRLDNYDRKIRELDRRIAEINSGRDPVGLERSSRPAFDERILKHPVPSRFKIPQMEPYDGTTDPLDHLNAYKATMLVQGASDALYCLAFPATLRKAARVWYSHLEPGSIHSFEQLERSFVAQFGTSRMTPRTTDSLFSIQQQGGESLKTYVARFKAAALEVPDLNESVAISAIKKGLRQSRFSFSLDKTLPRSYAELLTRADKYIRGEDGAVVRRESEAKPTPTKEKKKAPEASKGQSDRAPPPAADHRPRRRSPQPARFRDYTPLTMPRASVLMQIEGEEYLRRPPPMKSNPNRDQWKYCRFHRSAGHDTDECYQLRDEIEGLIRRGYLKKFIRDDQPPPALTIQAPPAVDNRPTAGVINMITGRPGGLGALSEDPSPKRKRSESVNNVISFSGSDLAGVQTPHRDAVVVSMTVSNFDVKRVLVDNGSSTDVLFYSAFTQMRIPADRLRKSATPLVGFTGDTVAVEGEITLPVTVGTYPRQATIFLDFTVVRIPSAYNAILGRPGLNALQAVVSTYHLLVKFPTANGVGEMRGDQKLARQCFPIALGERQEPSRPPVDKLDPRDEAERGEPAEQLESIALSPDDPSKVVRIGSRLPSQVRDSLISFLRHNADVFAWTASDMPGIPPEVITHRLMVDPNHRPVRQRRRNFAPERQRAIDEEVDKLLAAGFIREASYPDWLANVVMVKKASGKWRICIDFTDLNKACPKDSFPLPKIDQLVDATSGYKLLSFMDAFSGYNQIQMAPEDEERTAFTTDKGIYCYKVMPFGLKNAGATYQRLVNKVFKQQIGRNMEVYVDDMLVKSVERDDHVRDLREAFDSLRQHQMRLNPTKCVFGVSAGKFLGFLVTQRGIEVNPEKIKAILDMRPPTVRKEVQQLNGRIAALSRFISKSAERCLPFFKILRQAKSFHWSNECQQAFEDLKRYLASPPLLSKPTKGETLYLYLAASSEAISSVLVREDSDRTQKPIYYTSRVLHDAETRYSRAEKMVYSLVTSTQRLRPYFQAHTVVVLTDQPLRAILHRPDTSGRLAKWAIKLSEFDLQYRPRPSMKAQVLADFVAECTVPDGAPDAEYAHGVLDAECAQGAPVAEYAQGVVADAECATPTREISGTAGAKRASEVLTDPEPGSVWILHVDGASNANGSGAGLTLTSPEGAILEYALRFSFPASNNQAEYEALLAGLRLAAALAVRKIKVHTDSQLVSGQVTGEFEARDPTMAKYLQKVQAAAPCFEYFHISYIPRAENIRADALSRLATSMQPALGRTLIEHLEVPSIDRPDSIEQIDSDGPDWRSPLIEYLANDSVPTDRSAARLVRRQASQYILLEGQLYKRSFTLPLLKCLGPKESDYLLQEVHEGSCSDHSGGKSIALKALRQGYYWPTMRKDAADLVRKCDQCQRHAPAQQRPSTELAQLSAPWPFAQWGMDILGPFPPASGQRKFIVVAIDYFTKWVEAEALAQITESKIRDFVLRSIICRFGVPNVLITDNGRQFDNQPFDDFCAAHNISHRYTSVAHPQTNGEAEVTNRTILHGLKTKINQVKGRWADELPGILWAYRTTPRSTTGESPFNLTFGSEAVIPVEIDLPTPRVVNFSEPANSDRRRADLDFVEELRRTAQLRMASYRQRVARYYNRRVKPRSFLPGDLVLRKTAASKPLEQGKLAPRWEGPYKVTEVIRPGAYRLEDLDGNAIPRTWNIENLRMYYQ